MQPKPTFSVGAARMSAMLQASWRMDAARAGRVTAVACGAAAAARRVAFAGAFV
jgi:hypothetical protein